jgi:hypothetical protein
MIKNLPQRQSISINVVCNYSTPKEDGGEQK